MEVEASAIIKFFKSSHVKVMEKINSDILEKIRRQFDRGPYPRNPIDQSPKNDVLALYIHNIITAYYVRNKQVVSPSEKIILDAGCGSGYKTLCLAEANPGAKIVGIDISEESLKLARKRLKYHGFEQVEFYCITLEYLPSLGMQFDYINADEVLYILPDTIKGLKSMKSVLKPQGIIRTNLHSYLQRFPCYQAQSIFKMMGLMDENPEETEIEIVKDFFTSLKNSARLKQITWKPEQENNQEFYLMNYLFQGDKGFTMANVFEILQEANLELINMVNWRDWNIYDLFQEADNLPVALALCLAEMSFEQQLQLYELIHPVHRLLDFWCGYPQTIEEVVPVEEWTIEQWQTVKVYLHPQLKTDIMKQALFDSINRFIPFEISKYLPITKQENLIDSSISACLFPPLLESPQSLESLLKRWQIIHPFDPLTLKPITYEQAFDTLKQVLINQESLGYILLEIEPG